MIVAAAAALALGLAAAGCGGGDDEASDEPDTTLTETETDEETTDEETTEEDTTDGDTGTTGFDFSSEECQQLATAGAAFGQAVSSATTGADLSDEAEAFQEFADNAPEAIREDMQTLAGAYVEIVEVLADVNLETGETPSAEQIGQLTAALGSINQAEVTAAAERISAWATENCTG
jgi:hypothetical protein